MQNYQKFENIIANLHRTFYLDASVTWNKKIIGISGVERQIDVYIEDYSKIYPIKIVVDCKLYSSKVDIKDVESTWMLVNDVRANLGIIICNSDYTEGAIKRANDIGLLKLCLPIDSEHPQFSAKVAMPIIAQKGKLKYTVEIHPKTLLPIMRNSLPKEKLLKAKNVPKIITLYEFIIEHIKANEKFLNASATIENLNEEWDLFIRQKSKKYSSMIIKYTFTSSLVVSSVPIKEGKGLIEVLGRDREYVNGNFLIGSYTSTEYDLDETLYWKWRDFDPKKDFPKVYFSSVQLENALLDLEENFI